jgi:hypothetical protein
MYYANTYNYTPHNEVVGGILVSPCPSVCPSACRQILCRTITWVVFLRMFWNFISSLPVKRGGSLSFLIGTISNVLAMEIGWTDVGSGRYILVSETRVLDETTDLPQATDNLYHIMLYRVFLAMCEVRTRNFSGNRRVHSPTTNSNSHMK